MFKLFRNLEALEEIVVGGDPGEGISYAAAVGISKRFKDIPFTFHSRVESPQFGSELYKIGVFVKKKTGDWPLLAIERNIGAAAIEKVLDLGYPLDKLYKQKTFDRVLNKTEERIGWNTNRSNRRKMLDDLALDIRRKELKIYDEEIVSEMLTFVINERTNEPRPESGTFSDLILATAIANQLTRINTITAKWAENKEKPENKKILPEKAEGFIVEKWEEKRDWRNP